MVSFAPSSSPARQSRLLGLVSAAHFYSHFMGMVLPPLFPVLILGLGLSDLQLAQLIAVFAAATGIGQIPCGFLTDRLGGFRVLVAGLCLGGGALLLMAGTTAYWHLVVLMGVAGLSNSAFHPADYAILNSQVDEGRMGRAMSVHGFSGYLGWAAAPLTMLAISGFAGWRGAMAAAGVFGLAIAAILFWQVGTFGGDARAPQSPAPRGEILRRGVASMSSMPMVMMFLFFLLNSITVAGLTSFAVLAMIRIHGVGVGAAGMVLTGFLAGMAAGVLFGGWLADRYRRPTLLASTSLAMASLLVAASAVPAGIPFALVVATMTGGGFLVGVTSPSRDLIVRGAAPAGTVGVAFGFTSTGMAIGYAVGPILAGRLMHGGDPQFAVVALAGALALSIPTVVAVPPAQVG